MKLTGISKGAQEGTLLSTFEISSWLEGFINGLQNLLVLIQAGSNLLQFQSCWVLLNNLLQTGTSCNPWPYKPYVLYSYRAIVCCIHQFLVGKNSHFSRMPCKTVRIERGFFVCVKTKNTHTHTPTSINCIETILALLDYKKEKVKEKWIAGSLLHAWVHRLHSTQWMHAIYIHWRPRGRGGVHMPHMVTVI